MVGQRTTLPDADTDQLPDETEIGGWNLTIVKTVFVCFSEEPPEPVIETRFVTSNELRQDTDADGVSDLDEYFHKGDPQNPDTDGDGLSDKEEWDLRETEWYFHGPRLGLDRTDSDEDCLTDLEEVRGSDIPGIGHRTSDPTIDDSDHDGFSDAWEFRRSFTDPLNPDTDRDGAVDRLDLNPRGDAWMRISFTSLTPKDLPSPEARIEFNWNVPANDSSKASGRSGPVPVKEGAAMTPTADQAPGEFDVDDERGGTTFVFDFHITILDHEDRAIGFLDINPHDPAQPVQVEYDVAANDWKFAKQGGGFTEPGTSTTLETSQARLTFLFEDFSQD